MKSDGNVAGSTHQVTTLHVILITQPNLSRESDTFKSLQTVNFIIVGIDDSETECDLDDVNDWDVVLENKDDSDTETMLQQFLNLVS